MADVQRSSNEASIAAQARVRSTLPVYRRPRMNLKKFQKYWQEQHADIFTGIATDRKDLLSYQEVWGACIIFPHPWASGRLKYRPMSLLADVDEKAVNISHAMVLQSIQDRSPKISFGCRNLTAASQVGPGPLEVTLTLKL